MANFSTIRNDIAGDGDTISEKIIASYMNALRRIVLVLDTSNSSTAFCDLNQDDTTVVNAAAIEQHAFNLQLIYQNFI